MPTHVIQIAHMYCNKSVWMFESQDDKREGENWLMGNKGDTKLGRSEQELSQGISWSLLA